MHTRLIFSNLREMSGNRVLGTTKSYHSAIAVGITGTLICCVGSGAIYCLRRTLASREEVNQIKQEVKQEIKQVKEELKGDIKGNRDLLRRIYGVLTNKN